VWDKLVFFRNVVFASLEAFTPFQVLSGSDSAWRFPDISTVYLDVSAETSFEDIPDVVPPNRRANAPAKLFASGKLTGSYSTRGNGQRNARFVSTVPPPPLTWSPQVGCKSVSRMPARTCPRVAASFFPNFPRSPI